ncbi:hypothetical protein [Borrelia sp. A-FGy1]|nr:hypothetical protein [Borrelia sp. A-FGy1]
MKDGVRKPSGSRAFFNAQWLTKSSSKNNFSPFSSHSFKKRFTKGKKKGK